MTSFASQYRLTIVKHGKKIPTGLDGVLYRLAGRLKSRSAVIRKFMKDAAVIQNSFSTYSNTTDRELKNKCNHYKEEFKRKMCSDKELLFSALAVVHEAAFRTLGMRPYMVQTAGAIALLNGFVAEMATGEGKTLTASIAAIIRGWSGSCHIITTNDYLAERDAQKLKDFYTFCGISVGYVISTMEPAERKRGYAADVTYSTAKEVTADFLRDRLALGSLQRFERRLIRQVVTGQSLDCEGVVMRGLNAAIIDEADSLMIDEAVVPLIISRQRENEDFNAACRTAFDVSKKLIKGTDYTFDQRHKEINLADRLDINNVYSQMKMPLRYSGMGFQRELLRQALTAREFFHRGKHYVIQDDKVVIVDEFTGRSMPQRSWSDGLHQMIEAKEGVEITPPNDTLARISFQRFFRYYHYLSGMTGTGREEMSELWQVYDLPFIMIPRNRPCQCTSYPARIYLNQKEKWNAILDEIEVVHAKGRPVLVATRSVELSEQLADKLQKRGLKCNIINAVRHKEEAAIIAQAGMHEAITVATNMAGRGTDILLDKSTVKCGGLHVIATEFHESGRIDRQLYGRSGRQGDPGSNRTFAALDDELAVRYGNGLMRKCACTLFTSAKITGKWLAPLVFRNAQNTAQRKAAQSRSAVQKMDLWLDESLSFTREDVQ